MRTLIKTKLSLPLLHRGKVRDIFDIDDANMLIVTSDRLSAHCIVLLNVNSICCPTREPMSTCWSSNESL